MQQTNEMIVTLTEKAASRVKQFLEKENKKGHGFIKEQIEKCDKKIFEGDFDGAITNARSLLEGVLLNLEAELTENQPIYDGDLPKLYKRVQKFLNLDPSRKDISDTLKSVLGGFVAVISGISGLRNKMSDAHASTYKPERHHARLTVNAAKTVADFLYETYDYQNKKEGYPHKAELLSYGGKNKISLRFGQKAVLSLRTAAKTLP